LKVNILDILALLVLLQVFINLDIDYLAELEVKFKQLDFNMVPMELNIEVENIKIVVKLGYLEVKRLELSID
jgi:hypothetical protein